jgi:hypothetical protein
MANGNKKIQTVGLKNVQTIFWREYLQTKILARKYSNQNMAKNIEIKILAWKYSEQNIGLGPVVSKAFNSLTTV